MVQVHILFEITFNDYGDERARSIYGVYADKKKADREKAACEKYAEENMQDYGYEVEAHQINKARVRVKKAPAGARLKRGKITFFDERLPVTITTKADKYVLKFLRALKKARSDEKKAVILNKIYDDGFEDGASEGGKEQYQGSVIYVYKGVLQESKPFKDGKEAEKVFLKLCREHIPGFKKLSKEIAQRCVKEGYAETGAGDGDVYIRWF